MKTILLAGTKLQRVAPSRVGSGVQRNAYPHRHHFLLPVFVSMKLFGGVKNHFLLKLFSRETKLEVQGSGIRPDPNDQFNNGGKTK